MATTAGTEVPTKTTTPKLLTGDQEIAYLAAMTPAPILLKDGTVVAGNLNNLSTRMEAVKRGDY